MWAEQAFSVLLGKVAMRAWLDEGLGIARDQLATSATLVAKMECSLRLRLQQCLEDASKVFGEKTDVDAMAETLETLRAHGRA